MNEEIRKRLAEFHDANQEARNHFDALEFDLSKPFTGDDEKAFLTYIKWRTKGDIAINEYTSLLNKKYPGKLPYGDKLEPEHQELVHKLQSIENRLIRA